MFFRSDSTKPVSKARSRVEQRYFISKAGKCGATFILECEEPHSISELVHKVGLLCLYEQLYYQPASLLSTFNYLHRRNRRAFSSFHIPKTLTRCALRSFQRCGDLSSAVIQSTSPKEVAISWSVMEPCCIVLNANARAKARKPLVPIGLTSARRAAESV